MNLNNVYLMMSNSQKKKHRRTELSEDQKQEIKDAFELFDTEKTGSVSFHELKICLKAFGFDVKKKDMMELRREFDPKGTGNLNFDTFSLILTNKMMERDPLEEAKRAFKLFDEDGTGKISLKNLRRISKELGENLSDEELLAMIEEFDLDNDGEINESEFLAIMSQSSYLD